MTPVYNAPILDVYLKSLPTWGSPHQENGLVLLKIISQIAMSCYLLEKEIGFNHRDLKPDNILVKNLMNFSLSIHFIFENLDFSNFEFDYTYKVINIIS